MAAETIMPVSKLAFTLLIGLLACASQLSGSSAAPGVCNQDLLSISVGNGDEISKGKMKRHDKIVKKVKDDGDKLQMVIYGDSITEDLSEADDALEVYRDVYGETEAFGIGGDSVQNVLWRLRNGEWVDEMSPKFVAIMIGINNILRGIDEDDSADFDDQEKLAAEVFVSIRQLVSYIHRRSCGTHIILQALIPTAHNVDNEWPNVYTHAVEQLNSRMEAFAAAHPSHVHFADCGSVFLEETSGGSFEITEKYMKDLLHPEDSGHERMAECMLEASLGFVEQIVQESIPVAWGECSNSCGGGWQHLTTGSCEPKSDFLDGLKVKSSVIGEMAEKACENIEKTRRWCSWKPCPKPTAAPTAAPITPTAPTTKTTEAPTAAPTPAPSPGWPTPSPTPAPAPSSTGVDEVPAGEPLPSVVGGEGEDQAQPADGADETTSQQQQQKQQDVDGEVFSVLVDSTGAGAGEAAQTLLETKDASGVGGSAPNLPGLPGQPAGGQSNVVTVGVLSNDDDKNGDGSAAPRHATVSVFACLLTTAALVGIFREW